MGAQLRLGAQGSLFNDKCVILLMCKEHHGGGETWNSTFLFLKKVYSSIFDLTIFLYIQESTIKSTSEVLDIRKSKILPTKTCVGGK